jgi:hypothetical protein
MPSKRTKMKMKLVSNKSILLILFILLLIPIAVSLQPITLNRLSVSTTTGNINYLTGNLTNHSQLLGLYGGGVLSDNMYHLSQSEYNLRNSRYNSSYNSGLNWQYNMTSPFTTWLASFNYNYNQSTPVFTYITSQAPSWLVTYNASYDSGIQWQYNQTYSGNTYNGTYNKWAYNQSTPVFTYITSQAPSWLVTYNASYDSGIQWQYNQTYSGNTYNGTYNKWAYNQSLIGGIFNVTYDSGIKWFYNQTYLGSTYNETYANKNSSLWISTGVNIYNRNTGDVGIGTNNPAYKLDIEKIQDAGSKVSITNNDSGTGAYAELLARNARGAGDTDALRILAVGVGYTSAGGFINDSGVIDADSGLTSGLSIMTRANAPIRFYTNGHTNEVVRFTETGNVGIGMISPAEKLTVSGNIFLQNDSNKMYFGMAKDWSLNYDGANMLINRESGGSNISIPNGNLGVGTNTPASSSGYSKFIEIAGVAPSLILNDTDGTEFEIGSNSNILSFISSTGVAPFQIYGTGYSPVAEAMIIRGANVGIGNITPSYKLQVMGDLALRNTGTDTYLRMADSSGNFDRTILKQFATNDTYFGDIDANNGAIIFRTNGADRIKISTIGNVGIGTITPAVELDVERIQNTGTKIIVLNNDSGTGAYAEFITKNGRGAGDTDGLRILAMGAGYTSAGGFINDSGVIDIESGLTNGLSIMTRANAPIRFYTNGHTNEVVRFTETGRVGIGTTTPTTTLNVVGAVNITQNLLVQGNTTLYGQNNTLYMPNLKKINGTTACSNGDTLKWETGGRIYCG